MAILERMASKIAGKRDVLTPRDWKGEDTAPWTDAKILRPAGFAPEDYICTGCTACDAFPRPKQKRATGGEPAFYIRCANTGALAESAVKKITQQTAAEAVGVSDSRISDYLNKKEYENNAWTLAARFWRDQCADLQQLDIVADIIQNKLHHKLATIDKMDALALYTQIIPHFFKTTGDGVNRQ